MMRVYIYKIKILQSTNIYQRTHTLKNVVYCIHLHAAIAAKYIYLHLPLDIILCLNNEQVAPVIGLLNAYISRIMCYTQ